MKQRRSKQEHIKYVIERSCLNKKSFSEETANKVIDFLASKNEEMYFYKCDFCGSHHLTSRTPNVPKVIRIL
jgi:hypothetical protein